ncbi:unnamed protein product [Parnassius apollo]|uniref:(apollo) hypothetical protein n=1 Tax=Parnassius apollo TaxID=110799 RepID=A0A8S3XZT6_PARAO|nr:unnamed protein product [Parnassius apollo]
MDFSKMSTWRIKEEPPADFVSQLYADDNEDLAEDSEFESYDDEEEAARALSPEALPYSPLTSPGRHDQPGNDVEAVGFKEENRFPTTSPEGRDRSPIRPYPPCALEPRVVIEILDEDGGVDDVMDDVFLAPDAHAIHQHISCMIILLSVFNLSIPSSPTIYHAVRKDECSMRPRPDLRINNLLETLFLHIGLLHWIKLTAA